MMYSCCVLNVKMMMRRNLAATSSDDNHDEMMTNEAGLDFVSILISHDKVRHVR